MRVASFIIVVRSHAVLNQKGPSYSTPRKDRRRLPIWRSTELWTTTSAQIAFLALDALFHTLSHSVRLLHLSQESIKQNLIKAMAPNSVGTYLRFLRRKSGLSQRELAGILGGVTASQVSRHERSVALPSLLAALGYQVVFQTPVSDIFPGLYFTVESAIEERLRALEGHLGNSTAKGRSALPIARRLEWLSERKDVESV